MLAVSNIFSNRIFYKFFYYTITRKEFSKSFWVNSSIQKQMHIFLWFTITQCKLSNHLFLQVTFKMHKKLIIIFMTCKFCCSLKLFLRHFLLCKDYKCFVLPICKFMKIFLLSLAFSNFIQKSKYSYIKTFEKFYYWLK